MSLQKMKLHIFGPSYWVDVSYISGESSIPHPNHGQLVSKWIPPILQKTVVENCEHDNYKTVSIEKHESDDKIRPWLAIEFMQCEVCGGKMEKHWLTAYEE